MNEPIGYALNCNNCGKTIGYEEGNGDYEDCTFICVECSQEGVFEKLKQKRHDEQIARDKRTIEISINICLHCNHHKECHTKKGKCVFEFNWVYENGAIVKIERCDCNNYAPRGIL